VAQYSSAEQRWIAVRDRDRKADSAFFYGVVTTGIYCYPSCPSRLSLKENTRFFSTRSDAVSAGLRACRRCRSDEEPLEARQIKLVESACRLMDEQGAETRIDIIANTLGISRFHLQKLFQQYLSLSPKAYAKAKRSQRLEAVLLNSDTITQAVYDAGFENASTYYADQKSRSGMSATQYKSRAKDMQIQYGFGKSRFGRIIVATTEKGICCVLFGDSQKALLADLTERFSKARLTRNDQDLERTIEVVVEHLENPEGAQKFSLDIQGTAFQERVWQALRNINSGDTATYTDIAKAIGKPKAARAVASACAANPLAFIVPCHRVVRSTGEISGYRWGVERKKSILDYEGELKNTESREAVKP